MALFKKKASAGEFENDIFKPSSTEGLPTDLVLAMKKQGLSNNQIVQNLQREGYTSEQIFDAMNQADLKYGVKDISTQDVNTGSEPDKSQFEQPQPMPQQAVQAQQPYYETSSDKERIEEIAEAIIDEKWADLIKNVDKIVAWKEKTEAKITRIEQEFADLKHNFDNLNKAIIGKINDYDKGLANVGTEVKALEKVFQKVLPTLTENVNELSRITKKIKK